MFLLWLPALFFGATGRRKQCAAAAADAISYSTLLLILLLPTISTTISECLVCEEFDDGSFLRAQLSIPCDSSAQRKFWVSWAVISLALFPVGSPLLLVVVLGVHRREITAVQRHLESAYETDRVHLTVASLAALEHVGAHVSYFMISLASHYEELQPNCWWYALLSCVSPNCTRHSAKITCIAHSRFGPFLLVVRLAQTSLLTLLKNPTAQTAFATCVSLCSVYIQREVSTNTRRFCSLPPSWK